MAQIPVAVKSALRGVTTTIGGSVGNINCLQCGSSLQSPLVALQALPFLFIPQPTNRFIISSLVPQTHVTGAVSKYIFE